MSVSRLAQTTTRHSPASAVTGRRPFAEIVPGFSERRREDYVVTRQLQDPDRLAASIRMRFKSC